MTIIEAKNQGVLEYRTSKGDTLTRVVRRIYKQDDPIYYKILKTLNVRYDWSNLATDTVITYIPKNITTQISEPC